ncbi:ATP-binding SpoIIE family protein phosphatase [Pseudonocardia xishanensis]|uniref:Response regulatory domain-containing protein n=1 Tax=Pseudonocardia xishanensis TaxID=630995 RepID=A0ABP8RXK2_9PSEU
MAEPTPPITANDPRTAPPAQPLRVLLIEDDDADALLVEELFADVGEITDTVHVRSLGEALPLVADADCVLLDMNLPDAAGLEGLARLLAVEGHPAVVVLTGDVDETRGRAAVAAGAEDYLIKGRVDGQLLTRAVQYAVERRHVEHLSRQLDQARAHERENRRLGRGLLPTALLGDAALALTSRYQPGAQQLLLGGDFYDCIETEDGTVHLIIGDVSGHGPDEAAVGVSLRIAWRTLILAGVPAAHVLPILDQVLVTERHDPMLFTTVAMVSLAADRRRLALYLAGHPAPLLVEGTTPRSLPDHALGVPLGVRLGTTWPAVDVSLPAGEWALLLYTDGLIEARDTAGEVLWTDGLLELLTAQLAAVGPAWRTEPERTLDRLLATVDERAPLRGDDLALALLTHIPAVDVPRESFRYDPVPEACRRVRRDVRASLAAWAVGPDATDAAVVVANELASNAIDHARTPFGLTVTLTPRGVRLELSDGSAAEPQLQVHDVAAVRGRGLQMVQALSADWGFHHHDTGKTVVATIALDAASVAP